MRLPKKKIQYNMLSRRKFLKITGLSLGSIIFAPTLLLPFSRHAAYVGIAKSRTIKDAIRNAVNLAGGIDFIKKGDTVLVKPNVNSKVSYPGTTNPEVLYEIINLIWERDPRKIIISDRSGYWGKTIDFMKKTKIYDAAMDAGADVIPFDDGKWLKVKPESALHWEKGFAIPESITEVDHIISVPVLKTHILANFSMSIKNWVGLIPPSDRKKGLHLYENEEKAFGSMISEIHCAVSPSFIIMDGTKAFVSGGPSYGDIVEPGVIFASQDRIALDITGLAYLKHLGTTDTIEKRSIWAQPQIERAIQLGLGIESPEDINLKSDGIPEVSKIRDIIESG